MGGFSGLGALLGETTPQQSGAFQNAIYARKSPERKEQAFGDILSTEGVAALQRGGKLLEQPINYYSKLLGGDRQSMLSAVAPEVNTIVGQYDTAKRAAAQFSPRGGGRVQQLENLPYQQQGDITKLLETVRPEAAQAMTQISQQLQQLGISEETLGSDAYKSVMSYNLGKYESKMKLFGDIGKSVGSVLSALIMSGSDSGSQSGGGQ